MIREEWPRLKTKEPLMEEDPVRGRRRRD